MQHPESVPEHSPGSVMAPANRILIADDDPRIARLAARVAEKVGFETSIITDPMEFESEYGAYSPSVVLMDLNMPGRDGVELLRFLAEVGSTAAVILMSGVDERALDASGRLGKGLGLNMAGVIPKPFDLEGISAALSRLLSFDTERLLDDLPGAIENGEIYVRYQPKLDLRSGDLCGVEALARWRHPTYGEIGPDQFIPPAEESGLIVPLTYKVLELALRDSRLWDDTMADGSLAINISPILLIDLTLPDRILGALESHGFDPNRLILEVTETVATVHENTATDVLTRLRIKGIRLSIDDFGTGSSSLIKLYRLPYSELKIDKSFVMDAGSNAEAATIVKATISLAHDLGLETVAEGIEDAETLSWLVDLGCDFGQGYYFSPPLDASEMVAWNEDRKTDEMRLHELIRSKDEFIASISHELRTPLTAVVGFAELLQEVGPDISPEDLEEMISSINENAFDMSNVVEDLLVAARSKTGELHVTRESVNLAKQLAQVVAKWHEAMDVEIELDSKPVFALADPGRIRQILRNLIANAVLYGGNNIQVRMHAHPTRVLIQVRDDGPGIPDQDRETIFDPYKRSHTTPGRTGSIGLGLFVSRTLARLMDGDLTYTYDHEISIFEVTLPAAFVSDVPANPDSPVTRNTHGGVE